MPQRLHHPYDNDDVMPFTDVDLRDLQAKFDYDYERLAFDDDPDPWWIEWLIPLAVLTAIGVWAVFAKLLIDYATR